MRIGLGIEAEGAKMKAASSVGKRARPIADENKQPRAWFYLSFAGDTSFLGAAIVQGNSSRGAIQRVRNLGIHPGGEVMVTPLDASDMKRIAPDLRDRLLNEAEVLDRLEGKRVGE
jgi:hypothetical protein